MSRCAGLRSLADSPSLPLETAFVLSGIFFVSSVMRSLFEPGRPLVLFLRPLLGHGRLCPSTLPPLDLDTVSFLYPLVAAFRLVCAFMKSRVTASGYTQDQRTENSRPLRAFRETLNKFSDIHRC